MRRRVLGPIAAAAAERRREHLRSQIGRRLAIGTTPPQEPEHPLRMTVIEHRKRRRIPLQQQLPIRGLVVDHHPISRSRPHLVTEVNDASMIERMSRAIAYARMAALSHLATALRLSSARQAPGPSFCVRRMQVVAAL